MITLLLSIAHTVSVFFVGYYTAKLIRHIKDQEFLDELHSRICDKIRETDMIKNAKITEEDNTNA